jgi:endoglucanase
MKRIFLFFLLVFLGQITIFANLTIYKGGATLITGSWSANAPNTVASVSTDSPYEGSEHYKFIYTTSTNWAGIGLNMDNWGNSAAKNFSGFTHFRVAYRGLSSGQSLNVKLRNGSVIGSVVNVGGASASYGVIDITMTSLITNGLSAAAIREIDFDISSTAAVETGIVYIDAIELLNVTAPAPIANATCLARAASMGKGFNTSNWLEAFWLLPSNSYPVVNDYTRAKFQALSQAGFKHVRLPVIFEKLANSNPPYNLITNQTAFYLVDSAIVWANTFNMKLIIDNHHGYDLTDANFASEKNRKCAVWRQLVQRYGYLNPNNFFFEIYNEPNGISNANFRTIAQSVMDTVRTYNTTHTFIMGGNGWNSMSGLTSFLPLSDPNVIYTFHTYDPYNFTHQGMSWTSPTYIAARTFPLNNEMNELRSVFRSVKTWSNFYGVPTYMGEFGVGTSADATSRCNWVNHLTHLSDSLAIPWAYWDAKNYTDAFGFYPGSIITQANATPCFKSAMGLYSTPLATSEILGINARCNQESIDIQWISETFDKRLIFQIEGSEDGKQWEILKEISARSGQNRYDVKLDYLAKKRYFRVASLEADGHKTTSAIIAAACKSKNTLAVFPNPVSEGSLNISYSFGKSQNVKIELINSNGQLLERKNIFSNEEENKAVLDVSNLPKGLYFVRLVGEGNEVLSTKIAVE